MAIRWAPGSPQAQALSQVQPFGLAGPAQFMSTAAYPPPGLASPMQFPTPVQAVQPQSFYSGVPVGMAGPPLSLPMGVSQINHPGQPFGVQGHQLVHSSPVPVQMSQPVYGDNFFHNQTSSPSPPPQFSDHIQEIVHIDQHGGRHIQRVVHSIPSPPSGMFVSTVPVQHSHEVQTLDGAISSPLQPVHNFLIERIPSSTSAVPVAAPTSGVLHGTSHAPSHDAVSTDYSQSVSAAGIYTNRLLPMSAAAPASIIAMDWYGETYDESPIFHWIIYNGSESFLKDSFPDLGNNFTFGQIDGLEGVWVCAKNVISYQHELCKFHQFPSINDVRVQYMDAQRHIVPFLLVHFSAFVNARLSRHPNGQPPVNQHSPPTAVTSAHDDVVQHGADDRRLMADGEVLSSHAQTNSNTVHAANEQVSHFVPQIALRAAIIQLNPLRLCCVGYGPDDQIWAIFFIIHESMSPKEKFESNVISALDRFFGHTFDSFFAPILYVLRPWSYCYVRRRIHIADEVWFLSHVYSVYGKPLQYFDKQSTLLSIDASHFYKMIESSSVMHLGDHDPRVSLLEAPSFNPSKRPLAPILRGTSSSSSLLSRHTPLSSISERGSYSHMLPTKQEIQERKRQARKEWRALESTAHQKGSTLASDHSFEFEIISARKNINQAIKESVAEFLNVSSKHLYFECINPQTSVWRVQRVLKLSAYV